MREDLLEVTPEPLNRSEWSPVPSSIFYFLARDHGLDFFHYQKFIPRDIFLIFLDLAVKIVLKTIITAKIWMGYFFPTFVI